MGGRVDNSSWASRGGPKSGMHHHHTNHNPANLKPCDFNNCHHYDNLYGPACYLDHNDRATDDHQFVNLDQYRSEYDDLSPTSGL